MRKKKDAPKKKAGRKAAAKGAQRGSAKAAPRKSGARKAAIPRAKPRSSPGAKGKKKAPAKRGVAKKKAPAQRARKQKAPEGDVTIGSRELTIRGYWDRYPSSDQRKHHKKYDAIEKEKRRGPTAYDLLVRDYNRLTPAERKRIRVRVVYGVAPDTGKILTAQKINAAGMSLDLPPDRSKALASLQTLLVRAGTVDSPKEWRINKSAVRIENAVPVGIEWVLVSKENVSKGYQWQPAEHPRDASGKFRKRGP